MADMTEFTLKSLQVDLEKFIGRHDAKVDQLQRQVDAIDTARQRPPMGGGAGGGLGAMLRKFAEPDMRKSLDQNGRLRFETGSLLETKATITTTGITTPQGLPGITPGPRPAYLLRQHISSLPCDTISVFQPRESSYTNNASPTPETSPKGESVFALTGDTIKVVTLAHFCTLSRQALDDVVGLEAYLSSSLLWGLEAKIEAQLLSGSGTGEDIAGLITGATAFDTTILSPTRGWNRADLLAAAAVQLRELGYNASVFVVSPRDWFHLETLRDTQGRYLIGDPRSNVAEILWGKTVVPSPAITTGYFVAFDNSRCHIRQRMNATVEMSYQHGTNFTSNLVTVLAEERLALVKTPAAAAVYGAFLTSPA